MATHACMKCGGTFVPFQPKPGVQIGMCRKCKGLWFPRGMLAKQLQTAEATVAGNAGDPRSRGTRYQCITCTGTHLVEHPFAGDGRLLVDTCPTCNGIFLDANELPRAVAIANAIRKTSPTANVSPGAPVARAKVGPSPAVPSRPTIAPVVPKLASQAVTPSGSRGDLAGVLGASGALFVKQRKEWMEIITNWEMRNKYDVHDASGQTIAHVAEHGTGFGQTLARLFLKSHRPFEAYMWDMARQPVMRFQRPFYWFFSDLTVQSADGRLLGSIHRRWAWFSTRYELKDEGGRTYGWVNQPFWRIWRFPILDAAGREVGEITKKWAGVLREMFTSADAFQIQFGQKPWRLQERAVLLAAAITIDLDRFETQSKGGSGGVDLGFDLVSSLFD